MLNNTQNDMIKLNKILKFKLCKIDKKYEKFNINKTIYLNKSLEDEIIEIANDNGLTYQNALRLLLKQGIKKYNEVFECQK